MSSLNDIAKHVLAKRAERVQIKEARRKRPLNCVGVVAVNMLPASGSWGGSSGFVSQLESALWSYGYQAVYDLKGHVDIIIIIDPRDDLERKAFGLPEIRAYKMSHPSVKIIHRINECDRRKGTKFMDDILQDGNIIADYTVFISEWLRDYFSSTWFDLSKPNSVIYNGADPAVFHPVGSAEYKHEYSPLRLVTHHWSDNKMKGFKSYSEVDSYIADGTLEDVELWVIGRWPNDINWRSARLFPPASGFELAGLLRQCHAYITASLWEPCGMHHVEGAQCGLPLLFHKDGGGIVEAGKKYGVGFDDGSVLESIQTLKDNYSELRAKVVENAPDGSRMCREYIRIIQKLLMAG